MSALNAAKNIQAKISLDIIIIGAGIGGLATAIVSINLRK
jgi:ribulose 1,5-bisphosphate synthetase/thiazole synthase